MEVEKIRGCIIWEPQTKIQFSLVRNLNANPSEGGRGRIRQINTWRGKSNPPLLRKIHQSDLKDKKKK